MYRIKVRIMLTSFFWGSTETSFYRGIGQPGYLVFLRLEKYLTLLRFRLPHFFEVSEIPHFFKVKWDSVPWKSVVMAYLIFSRYCWTLKKWGCSVPHFFELVLTVTGTRPWIETVFTRWLWQVELHTFLHHNILSCLVLLWLFWQKHKKSAFDQYGWIHHWCPTLCLHCRMRK